MTRIVDLTQPLSPRSPRGLDHPEVEFPAVRHPARHGIYARSIRASLHTGTHIDAPSVFFQTGATVDAIPLDELYGPGVIVDVTRDDWGVISGPQLESSSPPIEPGDIVVLRTGWHRYYFTDHERYVLRQPGLDKSGVDWLVNRGVKVVVADSPSAQHFFMHIRQWRDVRPDVLADVKFDPDAFPPNYAHTAMLGNGIYMVDHAGGDIDEVVGTRCLIGAIPAKFEGVEGAPTRVFAVLE